MRVDFLVSLEVHAWGVGEGVAVPMFVEIGSFFILLDDNVPP